MDNILYIKLDIENYSKNQDFAEWWSTFKNQIYLQGYEGNEIQIGYSLLKLLPTEIKKYIDKLSKNTIITFEIILSAASKFYTGSAKGIAEYLEDFLKVEKITMNQLRVTHKDIKD